MQNRLMLPELLRYPQIKPSKGWALLHVSTPPVTGVTGSQGIFHSGHVHFTCNSHESHCLTKWVGLGVVVKITPVVTGHRRIF